MKISEVLIDECISEVYFRYAAKSEVYAMLNKEVPWLTTQSRFPTRL